jgi:hypothetical protein
VPPAADPPARAPAPPQVNVPNGPYPTPFADIYRGMAVIGTKGFGALPKHCGELMGGFFAAGARPGAARARVPRLRP